MERGINQKTMQKIRSAKIITESNTCPIDGMVGLYEVEIYGLKARLRGKEFAQAAFGSFQAHGRSILYTATVWAEHGQIYHDYDSEFADDLAMLVNGHCETFN